MSDSPRPGSPPRPSRGWRLIEVLVGMSIVVTLAGMLVPYSARVGERTALATAGRDLSAIAAAYSTLAATHPAWLRGSGALPAGCPQQFTPDSKRLDRLSIPATLTHEQRAALLLALRPDPWGSAYLVFVGAADGGSRVVSAGPDRVLGTPDDLMQPIR